MGQGFYTNDDLESDDESNEEDCLNIRLSKKEKQCIRAPWLKITCIKSSWYKSGFQISREKDWPTLEPQGHNNPSGPWQ